MIANPSFDNPGDSFADEKYLLDPGEKDVRNPAITMAIRRIGMCEQAGTGLRMMQREWQALGHAAPIHTNDRSRKTFTTFLPQPRDVISPLLTGEVERLVGVLAGELSRQDLQHALGLKHEGHFREAYLKPALALGLIEMTRPDKPRSRLQRYRLTELGRRVKQGGGRTP